MKSKTKKRIFKFLRRILLSCIVIITIFPFIVMIMTALKSDAETARGALVFIPEKPMFSNFVTAMQRGDWKLYFYNSTVITIITVGLSLIINSMAGFTFARLSFRGSKLLFYCAMIGMMLPMQVIMIPVFLQIKELPLVGGNDIWGNGGIGLMNNMGGVILPLIAHPFGMFMCRQFFMGFPKELDEAAKIDGCSTPGIYFRIYFPMAKPIFATLALLKTVDTWNQYTWPLLVFNDAKKFTVQLALNSFKGDGFVQWNYLMAATILIILPVLILFVCLQKYFVQGIASTGMKD